MRTQIVERIAYRRQGRDEAAFRRREQLRERGARIGRELERIVLARLRLGQSRSQFALGDAARRQQSERALYGGTQQRTDQFRLRRRASCRLRHSDPQAGVQGLDQLVPGNRGIRGVPSLHGWGCRGRGVAQAGSRWLADHEIDVLQHAAEGCGGFGRVVLRAMQQILEHARAAGMPRRTEQGQGIVGGGVGGPHALCTGLQHERTDVDLRSGMERVLDTRCQRHTVELDHEVGADQAQEMTAAAANDLQVPARHATLRVGQHQGAIGTPSDVASRFAEDRLQRCIGRLSRVGNETDRDHLNRSRPFCNRKGVDRSYRRGPAQPRGEPPTRVRPPNDAGFRLLTVWKHEV